MVYHQQLRPINSRNKASKRNTSNVTFLRLNLLALDFVIDHFMLVRKNTYNDSEDTTGIYDRFRIK